VRLVAIILNDYPSVVVRFNSRLVRLVVICDYGRSYSMPFQFQIGAIGRTVHFENATTEFCFNSRLVRLVAQKW